MDEAKMLADIHTHLLYGADDGAQTPEQMTRMLQQSSQAGVRLLFVTPHYHPRWGYDRSGDELLTPAIRAAAAAAAPDIALVAGNEIRYSTQTLAALQNGQASPLGQSPYVLIEFAHDVDENELRNALYSLEQEGYWPILAHAERYACLRPPKVLDTLWAAGVCIQLNADSILHGSVGTRLFCRQAVKRGRVDFIASDCHDETMRSPNLQLCDDFLRKTYGEDTAHRLLWENQQCVLHAQPIFH